MGAENFPTIFVTIAALLMADCATQPVPATEATPTKSVISSNYATGLPSTGEVIVKRDTGLKGAVFAPLS
jgi:hypothetical protein